MERRNQRSARESTRGLDSSRLSNQLHLVQTCTWEGLHVADIHGEGRLGRAGRPEHRLGGTAIGGVPRVDDPRHCEATRQLGHCLSGGRAESLFRSQRVKHPGNLNPDILGWTQPLEGLGDEQADPGQRVPKAVVEVLIPFRLYQCSLKRIASFRLGKKATQGLHIGFDGFTS